MTTTETPVTRCSCGYVFDMATSTSAGGAAPKPGDLTLCIRCGATFRFGLGLVAEPVDLDQLPMSPRQRREVRRIQRFLVRMSPRRPS